MSYCFLLIPGICTNVLVNANLLSSKIRLCKSKKKKKKIRMVYIFFSLSLLLEVTGKLTLN